MHHVLGAWKPNTWSLQTVYPRIEWLQALRKPKRDLGWLHPLLLGVLGARSLLSYVVLEIKEKPGTQVGAVSIWVFSQKVNPALASGFGDSKSLID